MQEVGREKMTELEKILEEIKKIAIFMQTTSGYGAMCVSTGAVEHIIRKHMNDGWISVDDKLPEKEYSTVLCVTDKNYYFVGVYNRKKRFRTGDIYAEGKVIAWMPLEPYQPERRDNHDGK